MCQLPTANLKLLVVSRMHATIPPPGNFLMHPGLRGPGYIREFPCKFLMDPRQKVLTPLLNAGGQRASQRSASRQSGKQPAQEGLQLLLGEKCWSPGERRDAHLGRSVRAASEALRPSGGRLAPAKPAWISTSGRPGQAQKQARLV